MSKFKESKWMFKTGQITPLLATKYPKYQTVFKSIISPDTLKKAVNFTEVENQCILDWLSMDMNTNSYLNGNKNAAYRDIAFYLEVQNVSPPGVCRSWLAIKERIQSMKELYWMATAKRQENSWGDELDEEAIAELERICPYFMRWVRILKPTQHGIARVSQTPKAFTDDNERLDEAVVEGEDVEEEEEDDTNTVDSCPSVGTKRRVNTIPNKRCASTDMSARPEEKRPRTYKETSFGDSLLESTKLKLERKHEQELDLMNKWLERDELHRVAELQEDHRRFDFTYSLQKQYLQQQHEEMMQQLELQRITLELQTKKMDMESKRVDLELKRMELQLESMRSKVKMEDVNGDTGSIYE